MCERDEDCRQDEGAGQDGTPEGPRRGRVSARQVVVWSLIVFAAIFIPAYLWTEDAGGVIAIGLTVVFLALPLVGVVLSVRLFVRCLGSDTRIPWKVFAGLLPLFWIVAAGALYSSLWSVYPASRESPRKARCVQNMRALGDALRMYAEDNDNRFPPPASWCDAIVPYLEDGRDVFVCPAAPDQPCGYALNPYPSGPARKRSKIATPMVLVFESDAGWNAHGGRSLLPEVARHLSGDDLLMADGRVIWVRRDDLREGSFRFIWSPSDLSATEPIPSRLGDKEPFSNSTK